MPRRRRETGPRRLPTIWRVSDERWAKIEPILAEHDPPKETGRKRIDQGARWMVSSTGSAVACNGTSCRKSSVTTARCIALSSVGCGWASSTTYGLPWSANARNSAASTGNGRPRMGR